MKKTDVGAESAMAESVKTKDKFEVKRPPGRPPGQSDDLTREEIQTIVRLPDKRSKTGFRDYVVLLVLANTPMRKGELVGLTIGSLIDEGLKKFILYKGLKKRKQRDKITGEIKTKQKPHWLKLRVATDVFNSILRYVESEHKGKMDHRTPLFMTLGKRGPYQKQGLTPKAVDWIVRHYVREAGIKKRITPHSFRATWTTIHGEGQDPATIIKSTGHASIVGVMPYLRTSKKKIEDSQMSHVVT